MNTGVLNDKHQTRLYESIEMSPENIRSRQRKSESVSLLSIIFNILSFISILLIWLLLRYIIKPVRRSFLCSDLTLYHPPPTHEVFPIWLLFFCALIIPLIVLILSECVRWYYLRRKKSGKIVYKIEICSKIHKISELFGNLYIIIGIFLFGMLINLFLTYFGKITVGRLRPHFIPSCFSKYSYKEFCQDPNEWISNYTCFGESSHIVKEIDDVYDIRQSFPSGHTSLSFYGLIFLSLYINKVWNYHNIGLFPYVIELICFSLSSYIGITRITDNRHHSTDVLAGAILGTTVAIIAFRCMINSFKRSTLLNLL